MGLSFLESPELYRSVQASSDFRFLQPNELEPSPTLEALKALEPGELRQLLYWKPERLGDIIFNFWD
ncbi:hypothetical protein [Deinococcus sp.]|uniref:hypothetical protein n=1 Tax=Deinococcus sp. TaxID=47478 RepID=UPI003C79EBBB